MLSSDPGQPAGDLHVFRSDCEWIVGLDIEDALTAYETKHLGERLDDEARDPGGWRMLADDEPLTIIDDVGIPKKAWTRTTKTCGEWARENGTGFLCSTEW